MTTKHTPGPWMVRAEDSICPVIDSPSVGAGYYASLATVTQRDAHPKHGGGIDYETAQANARLIAAAPELLAALEILVESGALNAGSRAIANAVIAKATNS